MLDANRLLNWTIPEIRQTYTAKDTILYALGIGFGGRVDDRDELRYVYEKELRVAPSMALVLGYPGFWLKEVDAGFDWRKVLHGEQTVRVFNPLPTAATVIGRTRVVAIYDKGPGRDAVLVNERDVIDAASGELLSKLSATLVLRGASGFGGPPTPAAPVDELPEGCPDAVASLSTSVQSALIYRLSGDMNPLHADPEVAAAAGFPRPILHGLCTLGTAMRAVAKATGLEIDTLTEFGACFSAPVFPGETISAEVWHGAGRGRFQCRVLERDKAVLTRGFFTAR